MAPLISGALMALNLARHTACAPGGGGRIQRSVLSSTCRWSGGVPVRRRAGSGQSRSNARGTSAALRAPAHAPRVRRAPRRPSSACGCRTQAAWLPGRLAARRNGKHREAITSKGEQERHSQKQGAGGCGGCGSQFTSKHMFSPSLSQSSHSTRWSAPLASDCRCRHRCIWGRAGRWRGEGGQRGLWRDAVRRGWKQGEAGQGYYQQGPRGRPRPQGWAGHGTALRCHLGV